MNMTFFDGVKMAAMLETRMSKEGRVLIPAEFRRSLGLRPDEPLQIYTVDGELRVSSIAAILTPSKNVIFFKS